MAGTLNSATFSGAVLLGTATVILLLMRKKTDTIPAQIVTPNPALSFAPMPPVSLTMPGFLTETATAQESAPVTSSLSVTPVVQAMTPAAIYAGSSKYPGGITLNNPGNLRYISGNNWQGQTGSVDGPGGKFVVFDTAANGLRAMAITLLHIWQRGPTVRQIVSAYSPASENPASLPLTYANNLGLAPDQVFNLKNVLMLARWMDTAIRMENGTQPYPASLLQQAADTAIKYIG